MTLKENGIYMKPYFFDDKRLKTLHEHFESEIWIVCLMEFAFHQK